MGRWGFPEIWTTIITTHIAWEKLYTATLTGTRIYDQCISKFGWASCKFLEDPTLNTVMVHQPLHRTHNDVTVTCLDLDKV
jgi:hypothetical protein